MKTLRQVLREKFEKDKKFKEKFFSEIEKTRLSIELAYLRERKNITQTQLAELFGLTQGYIAKLESPFYNKSIRNLKKVIEFLKNKKD